MNRQVCNNSKKIAQILIILLGEADLDPRAFAEPVDIVSKLSSTLQNDLKSSKWKERKEALDDLSALLSSTPRIKDAPELAELAKSLATRIASDANINCVMVASKCMEDLAKGMMSSFSRLRESVVSPMLERLKERKTNVTDSIGAALDAVFSTVGPSGACACVEFMFSR
jgi:cytoskeleton-associated protein 5